MQILSFISESKQSLKVTDLLPETIREINEIRGKQKK
jgi:hypothetical protein